MAISISIDPYGSMVTHCMQIRERSSREYEKYHERIYGLHENCIERSSYYILSLVQYIVLMRLSIIYPTVPPGATCGESRGIFLSFEQNTCPKGGEFDLILEIIF